MSIPTLGWRVLVQGDKEAQAAMQNLRNEFKNTDTASKGALSSMQQNSKAVEQSSRNWKQGALGIGAFASGVAGLVTNMDSLQRVQVQANRAALTHEKAIRSLQEAQDKLAKAQGSSTATARDLEQAQKDVELAQERVGITADQLSLAQNRVQDTYINFFTNIGPQVLSLTFGLTSSMGALGISTTGASKAVIGFGHAVKGAMLAMGPIGWVLLGIGTAFALVATNAFGVRDALEKLAGDIQVFLDKYLKPLGDAWRWLIDNVFKPIGEWMGQTFPEAAAETGGSLTEMKSIGVDAYDSLGTSAARAGTEVETATRKVLESQSKFRNILKSTGGIGEDQPAFGAVLDLEKMIQGTLNRAKGTPGARNVQVQLRELAASELEEIRKQFGLTSTQMERLTQNVGGFVQRIFQSTNITQTHNEEQERLNDVMSRELELEISRTLMLDDSKQAMDRLITAQQYLRETFENGTITNEQYQAHTAKLSEAIEMLEAATRVAGDEIIIAAKRISELQVSRKGRVSIPGREDVAPGTMPPGDVGVVGTVRRTGGGESVILEFLGRTVDVLVENLRLVIAGALRARGVQENEIMTGNIMRLLGLLNPSDRQTLLRRYFQGFSFGEGGTFTVDRPTPILVGEKGRELVDIMPVGSGGARSIMVVNHFHIAGDVLTENALLDRLDKRLVNKILALVRM